MSPSDSQPKFGDSAGEWIGGIEDLEMWWWAGAKRSLWALTQGSEPGEFITTTQIPGLYLLT